MSFLPSLTVIQEKLIQEKTFFFPIFVPLLPLIQEQEVVEITDRHGIF